jgi:hypothetical protein
MAEVMTKARTKARNEQVLSLRRIVVSGVGENDDTLSDISFSKNTKI